MTRLKKLWLVVLLFSLTFFLVQIFFLKHVSKQGHKLKQKSDNNHRHDFEQEVFQYNSIKEYLELCQNLKLPTFLIDPAILEHIMGNVTISEECKHLCLNRPVTVFGATGEEVFDWEQVQHSFSKAEYEVMTTSESDPRLLSVDSLATSQITTHMLLHKAGSYIHLVIFYERSGGFLWHGSLPWDSLLHTKEYPIFMSMQDHIEYGPHTGAYDKFERVPVNIDGIKFHAPKYPTLLVNQIPHSRFLECNHTRAKTFYSLHGRDGSTDAMAFKKAAVDLLSRAKKCLDELNIRFWLSSGTCLGWFRQCDIIPYSKDVDIGIWIKDYDIRLTPAMHMSGMPLIHLFGKESDSFEMSFRGGDMKLDVFFFYEEGDTMWNGGTQARTGNKYKYIFPKFSLCWTEFQEMKVRVPCETQSYVEANYGKEWFTPVKHWDWKKSPPNVYPNGQWPEDERDEVIRLFP